jgi:hypothetical protein
MSSFVLGRSTVFLQSCPAIDGWHGRSPEVMSVIELRVGASVPQFIGTLSGGHPTFWAESILGSQPAFSMSSDNLLL